MPQPLLYPLTCHFQRFLLTVAVCLTVRARLGSQSTEGVGYALVGSFGLTVDAVV